MQFWRARSGVIIETHTHKVFESFSEDVTNIDGRMIPKDLVRRVWSISHIELFGAHVQIGSLGSGIIFEGQSWSDGYLVYLPLLQQVNRFGSCRAACDCARKPLGISESHAYAVNGTVIDGHSILVLEPGSDFCLSVTGPNDGVSLFVPTQMLGCGSGPLDLSPDGENLTNYVIHMNRQLEDRFRLFIDETEFAALNSLDFEATRAAKMAAAEAVKLVSLIVGDEHEDEPEPDGRPRIPRQEIIRRCKGLLEEREGDHIFVGEFAAAAHVSERTLQTAFKEYFGVGPTRYVQLRRLWQIRSALLTAQADENNVTEILTSYGEYEFGRFAARYSQMFGELPSQTLQGH